MGSLLRMCVLARVSWRGVSARSQGGGLTFLRAQRNRGSDAQKGLGKSCKERPVPRQREPRSSARGADAARPRMTHELLMGYTEADPHLSPTVDPPVHSAPPPCRGRKVGGGAREKSVALVSRQFRQPAIGRRRDRSA
jgi:hypothetical protein